MTEELMNSDNIANSENNETFLVEEKGKKKSLSLLDQIKKDYGDVITSGQNLIDNKKELIHWSPNLDLILGGGVCAGDIILLNAPPKHGKTVSALHLAGNAQKVGYKIAYDDVEHRLKPRDLQGIKNLKVDEVEIIRSTPSKLLSGEDHLQIVEKIMIERKKCLCILDSISQLCVTKEMIGVTGEQIRNPINLFLAQFCRKIANILPINDNVLVLIAHCYSNNSGYGSPTSDGGGSKIRYAANIKLKTKGMEYWKTNANSDPHGQLVTWITESTSICAPGRKGISYLRYGVGLDEICEYMSIGIDMGLIIKGGAWYSSPSIKDEKGNEIKFHGEEQLYQYLSTHESQLQELSQQINQLIYQDG
jgi:recombination protein RecA